LFVNGFAETYEVSDEDGNTYSFTAEHKVKVASKGWVRVDELSEGDDIVKF
jgi:intein/homing endonuclease